jgi:hypothetical protein
MTPEGSVAGANAAVIVRNADESMTSAHIAVNIAITGDPLAFRRPRYLRHSKNDVPECRCSGLGTEVVMKQAKVIFDRCAAVQAPVD